MKYIYVKLLSEDKTINGLNMAIQKDKISTVEERPDCGCRLLDRDHELICTCQESFYAVKEKLEDL